MTYRNKLSCFAESCTLSSYPLHAHECYEIELIRAGRFHNVIDGADHVVDGDAVFLYMPYTRHYYFSDFGGEGDIIRIGFTESFIPPEFCKLLLSVSRPIAVDIDNEVRMKLLETVRKIMFLYNNYDLSDFTELYLKLEVSKLIVSVYELNAGHEEVSCQSSDDKMCLIKSYIQNNFRSQISLSELSSLVGMSESYFSRYFRTHQGISYSQYITGLRMNYAVSRLKTSEDSISKISEDVGYYSVSGFIKSFTKYFGAHPNQFRTSDYETKTRRREKMHQNQTTDISLSSHIPIPVPKKYSAKKEQFFALAPTITAPTEFGACADVLSDYLKRMYDFHAKVTDTDTENGIRMVYAPTLDEKCCRVESSVESGLVTIYASSVAGFSNGGAIVLQAAEMHDNVLVMPECSVFDKPDVAWRGFMVDLARGHYSIEDILKYADICYYYRLSVLHLRFSDDTGYLLPSKHFPSLTDRRGYCKADIEYIVKYLDDRGITLLPEIEMPGHASPLTEKYPEVFGANHNGQVCAGMHDLFGALDTLISEVCELFPNSSYIHVGCDEVNTVKWEECDLCRKFMEENGISSGEELYGYMLEHCTNTVLEKGRTPVVWEGFSKNVTDRISREVIVMVFQSTYQNAAELTNAGFRVINTSWQPLYIVPSRPKYWQPDEIYKWKYNKWLYEDAVDDSGAIIVDKTELVMGGEVCLWEGKSFCEDGDMIENNIAVGAERLWNTEAVLTYDRYAAEKSVVSAKLARILQV